MASFEMGTAPEQEKLSLKDMLIQSGIAERILNYLKKDRGSLEPEITFSVEDCDFEIEQHETHTPQEETDEKEPQEDQTESDESVVEPVDDEDETVTITKKVIQITVEKPNLNPISNEEQPRTTRDIFIEEGGYFGTADTEPLTQEQWSTLQSIADKQEFKKMAEKKTQ